MQVREILRVKGPGLFTIEPQQTLADAIRIMAEHDLGWLAVLEGDRFAGMLTFRELLLALHASPEHALSRKVSELMVTDPVSSTPEMELDDLRRLMVDQRIRFVPVFEDGKLLTVITFHDVAKAVLEEQSFENLVLKNYIRNWPEAEKSAD